MDHPRITVTVRVRLFAIASSQLQSEVAYALHCDALALKLPLLYWLFSTVLEPRVYPEGARDGFGGSVLIAESSLPEHATHAIHKPRAFDNHCIIPSHAVGLGSCDSYVVPLNRLW